MKVEQAKQIANNAIEQLRQALEAGHSERLNEYLAAMARFRRYSWLCVPEHKKLYVNCRTMLSAPECGSGMGRSGMRDLIAGLSLQLT